MKNYYGPYVRASASDKWHWKKECPQYPKGLRIENMVSSITPDTIQMCDHCTKLDNVKDSNDHSENNKIESNLNHLTDRQMSNNKFISEQIRDEQIHPDINSKKQA